MLRNEVKLQHSGELRDILIIHYLLVLANPPRLPVMIGPKISLAILKYGVLLLPEDIWNGPIEKSLKTPRMNCDSSCSSAFWLALLLLFSGSSSINPSSQRGHRKS